MNNDPVWLRRAQQELEQARSARASGKEGMARVCARRAAGIIAAQYLQQQGFDTAGPSAYDRLKHLSHLPDLPSPVREVVEHFLLRVTTEHDLPVEADLVAEARWLAQALLGQEL